MLQQQYRSKRLMATTSSLLYKKYTLSDDLELLFFQILVIELFPVVHLSLNFFIEDPYINSFKFINRPRLIFYFDI